MENVSRQICYTGRGLSDYVCFTEIWTVDRLIRMRSRLDLLYLFEPTLSTYIDLDLLIDTCGLSVQQQKIVSQLMNGYGMTDVAGCLNITHQAAKVQYQRALQKIASRNEQKWLEVYTKKCLDVCMPNHTGS